MTAGPLHDLTITSWEAATIPYPDASSHRRVMRFEMSGAQGRTCPLYTLSLLPQTTLTSSAARPLNANNHHTACLTLIFMRPCGGTDPCDMPVDSCSGTSMTMYVVVFSCEQRRLWFCSCDMLAPPVIAPMTSSPTSWARHVFLVHTLRALGAA